MSAHPLSNSLTFIKDTVVSCKLMKRVKNLALQLSQHQELEKSFISLYLLPKTGSVVIFFPHLTACPLFLSPPRLERTKQHPLCLEQPRNSQTETGVTTMIRSYAKITETSGVNQTSRLLRIYSFWSSQQPEFNASRMGYYRSFKQ